MRASSQRLRWSAVSGSTTSDNLPISINCTAVSHAGQFAPAKRRRQQLLLQLPTHVFPKRPASVTSTLNANGAVLRATWRFGRTMHCAAIASKEAAHAGDAHAKG